MPGLQMASLALPPTQKLRGSKMAPEGRPKAARVTDDVFASVIRDYMKSPKWVLPPPEGYADATKKLWGDELRFAAHPDCLGAVSVQSIRPALVQAFLDGLAGRPGKQAAALSALKQLEKWAIVRDILARPITLGVETGRPQGGHKPWTDDQVELAEQHAHAHISRAITLAANTGQRGSDLVRMGPTDIERFKGIDGINVTQKKTKRQVWIPITSALAAAMATWERRPGPFLLMPTGQPWDRKALSRAWNYHRETSPALAVLREATVGYRLLMHGLRGTACVRLRRAGASIPQIADTVGMSVEMVEHYCRFSKQRENAVAAVFHLERTLQERTIDKSHKAG